MRSSSSAGSPTRACAASFLLLTTLIGACSAPVSTSGRAWRVDDVRTRDFDGVLMTRGADDATLFTVAGTVASHKRSSPDGRRASTERSTRPPSVG